MSRAFLCLKRRECRRALNHVEGCPDRPPRPGVHSAIMRLLQSSLRFGGCEETFQAFDWIGGLAAIAIAQAKPASSRAMATVMTLVGLPARWSRR